MNSMFKLFQEFLSVQSNQSKLVITSQTRGRENGYQLENFNKGLVRDGFLFKFFSF